MHTHTLTHRPFVCLNNLVSVKEAHAVNILGTPWLFKRLFLNKMLPHRLADIYLIRQPLPFHTINLFFCTFLSFSSSFQCTFISVCLNVICIFLVSIFTIFVVTQHNYSTIT
ncbi:hypothetical protein BDB00DRAFT_340080 [Zychaea mexicana]|uniref:uncharacterized protein n=1 Tax=Zychaea mexicana TaxID=64656 RepID=UPI0022FF4138|nr:uncharacterized protein BDB00DRAFT_340080 [Zychaea mexicana]KAI9493982.1 hypothetical protein BDB00DRAFT_340080 [Zychaea mexicana]